MKQKIIIITGPTGCGKTELAVKLAKKFNGEIVGADSRQIYRGMKIGTAAPCKHVGHGVSYRVSISQAASAPCLYKGIKHYLVGFLEPSEVFSAAEFKDAAIEIIKDMLKRGKTPFLVGGSAHYIQAIAENLSIPRVPPDWNLRKKLEKKSLKALISRLKKIDPASLEIVDLNNKRRIIRALEVCLAGFKFSQTRKMGKPLFNILFIGINIPREELYKRIDARVDKMIEQGLVKETKNLIKYFRRIPNSQFLIPNKNSNVKCRKFKNLSIKNFIGNWPIRLVGPSARVGKLEIGNLGGIPALSGIGYKEIIDYLAGKITLEEAAQLIKYRTHKYVRYQTSWFKKNKKIKRVTTYQEAAKKMRKFLQD